MSGPIVVLDDGRPGREASRIPTLLQSAPRAQRAGREAAGFGRSSTDKPRFIRLAEALSRVVSDADCRMIYEFASDRILKSLAQKTLEDEGFDAEPAELNIRR